ncbi:hypothetical protein [Ilumatobacter sp.]|uniref:hypothetical protein n=1 Tax=Ilumatobacter sp. TaxID=1967498 RepID=UPI003C394C59
MPHRPGHTKGHATVTELDVLVIAELRFPGGTSTSLVEELIAARDAGYRVGVLHLASPRLGPTASVHPGLRRILDEGIADLVLPGESVRAPLTIVKHPMAFAAPLGAALPVDTDTVIVTVGQVPADAAEVYYDPKKVDANIVEALGSHPNWAPVSAAVRATLHGVEVADDDWTEIIDVDRWRRPVEKREHDVVSSADVTTDLDDRLVIGRHSRPHPLKWPGEAEVLRAVYPTDGSVRVRVLGGADAVSDILGEEPDGWEVFPFGSVAPREFLAGLDAFVYYHHSDLTEAFGRTILEALAVGVPVVVPHHFRMTFGDACVYADAECALAQLQILLDDPAALRAHLDRTDEIVRTRFGHDAHGARIRRLVGPPSSRVGDVTTAAVPSLALVPPGMRSSYATTLVVCLGAANAELEDAIRVLDQQRRQAPGFIPIIVVEGTRPPLAAELGIETAVITSQLEWDRALEPWSVYAQRRLRQLAVHHQVDNVVPIDLAGVGGSIVLQMRSIGTPTHIKPRQDALSVSKESRTSDQRRIQGLEAQITRLRSRRSLRLADMAGGMLRGVRGRLDAMRSAR